MSHRYNKEEDMSSVVVDVVPMMMSSITRHYPVSQEGWQMAEMNADAVLLVTSWLHQAQIRAYIRGGWGIDALLGYQTRAHADLDVAFDANTDHQVMQLFGAAGYTLREDARPVRFVLSNESNHVIDFHPVVFDQAGIGIQQGFEGVYRYPAHDLIQGTVAGVAVPCISVQLQIHFHAGYRPTEKDCADMQVLHHAFGVTLPASYVDCAGNRN